jgi:ribonuclease H2 subunit C
VSLTRRHPCLPCILGESILATAGANFSSQDGMKTAYFRGRKLHGKTLALPKGYRGVVAEKKAPEADPSRRAVEDPDIVDLDREDEPELGSLHVQAQFDDLVIWGHESVADASSDPYVRGLEEWLDFANQVCLCTLPNHPSSFFFLFFLI